MPYATDPSALFIQLYDQLPEQVFARREPQQWERDPWVKLKASRVHEQILDTGVADPEQIDKILSGGGHREIFTVLRGIDWALRHTNPFDPIFDYGKLARLVTRYAETGCLNEEPEVNGALLPRCAYPGRPRGTSGKELYFGLHRVPPEYWARIRHQRVKSRHDPNFRPGQEVRVGCAPLLESFADVQLEFSDQQGEQVYNLAPIDSAALRQRITSVIHRLDDSGARIGIMPEATLTDELLTYWRKALRETAAPGKSLRWLLVGSGPLGDDDPPPNRAVLLDRWSGEVILTQDKMAGFTLTPEQISVWKLPGRPTNRCAAEYLTQGLAIALLESSLGRLAVVICEDLNQSSGWERELISCGVSHLLGPIFSKPILRFRWEQIASERHVNNMGAWLIIANSLVVKEAMNGTLEDGKYYTCLVAGPGDVGRSEYKYDLQFGVAEAGDQLGQVDVDGSFRLPTINAGAVHDEWYGIDPDPHA